MNEPLIAANRFGSYSIPRDCIDRPAVQAALSGSVWELETIEFIASVVGSGDVVHAGAFFGDMLPALSASVAEGATVWAFEPNAQSFAHASRTIEMNGLSNVRLQNAALGDKEERRTLVTGTLEGVSLGGASFVLGHIAGPVGAAEQIEIVRIDSAVPRDRRVTVVHLDVERFETFAVKGALETIRQSHPILILESARPPLRAILIELGYALAGGKNDNKIYAHPNGPPVRI